MSSGCEYSQGILPTYQNQINVFRYKSIRKKSLTEFVIAEYISLLLFLKVNESC